MHCFWHNLWQLSEKDFLIMRNYFFTVLLLVSGMMVGVAQNTQASIEVVGKFTAKAIPEELTINIPVNVKDTTYLKCANELNEALHRLQKDLYSQGLSDELVKTTNYSINENFDYINGKRILNGYKGSVSVNVTSNYDQKLLSRVLKVIRSHEHQFQVNFQLTEAQKKKLVETAIEKSVSDANEKALALTKASGVELGNLIRISYGTTNYRTDPLTRSLGYVQADQAGIDELNLSPPMNSVLQTVLMVWEIGE